jgi:hypothetical protein
MIQSIFYIFLRICVLAYMLKYTYSAYMSNKIIAFNKELLAFPDKSTRKRTRPSGANATIKMRPHDVKPRVKRAAISYMSARQHQNLHSNEQEQDADAANSGVYGADEFSDSLEYMHNIARKYSAGELAPNQPNVVLPGPAAARQTTRRAAGRTQKVSNTPDNVVYGCMKRGSLPTFKKYLYTLRATLPESSNLNKSKSKGKTIIPTTPPTLATVPAHIIPPPMVSITNMNGFATSAPRVPARPTNNPVPTLPRAPKLQRRRTIKRDYQLGKSIERGTTSVLVSNRTVRNQIKANIEVLKEAPIGEVRRYLLKHSLIKAGATPPHAVMRQIYESANLICGEICNRNPHTFLHNYLYDDKFVGK